MKPRTSNVLSVVLLVIAAALAFDNSYWYIRNNPGHLLRPVAMVYFADSAHLATSTSIIENNLYTTMMPEEVVARGRRNGANWELRVPFGLFPYRMVHLNTNEGVLIRNIILAPGDTLYIAPGDAGYEFAGNAGAKNTLYAKNSTLYSYAELGLYEPGEVQDFLDRRLDERLAALQHEFARRDYPELVQQWLVGTLYCQWARPQALALARTYNSDYDPATSASDAELAFLDKVPDMAYMRADDRRVLTDFERDVYLDRAMIALNKSEIDSSVINAALDTIAARCVAARRWSLDMSVIEWAVANRYDECYSMLERAIDEYRILEYIFDEGDNAQKLLQKARAVSVGGSAPLFTAEDIDGNMVRLRSLLERPVVLDFWGTWCGPCKAKLPLLQRMIESTAGEIEWVFVAQEWGALEKWREYVHEHELKGIQIGQMLSQPGALSRTYLVTHYPTTILIGKDGTIIDNDASWLGRAGSEQSLRNLLLQ